MVLSRRKRVLLCLESLESRELLSTLPNGFVEETVVNGLSFPTAMTVARDGAVYIAEKGGTLRIVRDGVLGTDPVLSLAVNSAGERGLIGLELGYASDSSTRPESLFTYYTTATAPAHNRLSRFALSGDQVVPGSETVLFDLEPVSATNHNGGSIVLRNNVLYVAVGDHGTSSNAQRLDNRFGKVLAVNQDGSIPPNMPFVDQTTGPNQSIWALGLRNPFGMELDPATGRLYADDAGQNSFEEVNEIVRGGNYGWPQTEGPTNDPRFIGPIFSYPTGSSGSSVIVGGAVYSPTISRFPEEFRGDLFVADFTGGIRVLDLTTHEATPFLTNSDSFLTDLATAPDGSLYVLGYSALTGTSATGSLNRVRFVQPVARPGASEGNSDFDGDGKADFAVYGIDSAEWTIRNSTGGDVTFAFGSPGMDEPIPADYDGDGRADLAVFRSNSDLVPGAAHWFVRLSSGGVINQAFGQAVTDVPVPADYDGDGRVDLAVYRPGTAEWLILGSRDAARRVQFGFPGVDLPIPADYDGDGRADLAVFRPNSDLLPGAAHWLVSLSTGGVIARPFGQANADIPIPADYDGDHRADLAVFRPNTGETFAILSTGTTLRTGALLPPDDDVLPVSQDFGGNGRVVPAVYSTATASYGILSQFTAPSIELGRPSLDVPVQRPLARRNLIRIGTLS
jgi:glucose/arabinose dehydrogenase